MTGSDEAVQPAAAAFDRLMPMHLRIGEDGTIRHAGPVFRRIDPVDGLIGCHFFDAFELMRPASVDGMSALKAHGMRPLKLRLFRMPDAPLRAVAVPDGDGLLMNLSFGISVVDAVRRFGLTSEDFAPTDLAVELLYMVEAKSAIYDESRRLNARLSEARAAAETQANTDALTGLKNRRAFLEMLEAQIARAIPFALLHVDLDHFKEVNDAYGHAAGDRVLEVASQVLSSSVRGTDVVARVGGDEFVLLLPGFTDADGLAALADRMIAALEEPVAFEDVECRISASIGVTTSLAYDRPDGDEMLRDADAALYLSKRAGRRRATIATREVLASGVLDQVLQPAGASAGQR